jgi:hypothetical protein
MKIISAVAIIYKNLGRIMKIAVFYHIYQYGPWEAIFNDQWKAISESNLLHAADLIHIGINGKIFGESGNPHIKVRFNPNPQMEESDTLKDLSSFALNNPEYKILYIHTKGASNYTKNVNDWRNMMNYFCIEEWRDCVKLLNEYDAVGCNILTDAAVDIAQPHFSGNFWWANAEYISKLDYSYLNHPNRLAREFWIGTGNGNMYEIHNSGVNHYDERYPREMYVK